MTKENSGKKPLLTIVLAIILWVIGFFLRKTSDIGVQVWDTVSIEYTTYFEDLTIFDTNIWWELLTFEVWAGDVIKGLDDNIVGMKVEKIETIIIIPKDWYGKSYNPRKIQNINSIVFRNLNIIPEIGAFHKFQDSEGIIKEIQGEWENQIIIMDTNPRHTRQELTYEINVKSIISNNK